MNNPRILKLSLKKKPFEVMVTGEKKDEFRKWSNWIVSRLFDTKTWKEKEYDLIKFTNGYGNDRPYFICEYKGFTEVYMPMKDITYSNGLVVEGLGVGDFIIHCGEIIEIKGEDFMIVNLDRLKR